MFKVFKNLSETTFSDLFIRRENKDDFRRNREFQILRLYTVWNDPNSFRCFEPIIWDLFPSEHKCSKISRLEFVNGNLGNVHV